MRMFARFALGTALAAAGIVVACGEDTATVRERTDGGGAADGGDGGVAYLACGVPVPATYDSPAFATNAKEELDLKARYDDLESRMKAAEGASTSIVAASELRAIYEQGTPSLKSVSTSSTQAVVDGYFTALGDAMGKTWTPESAEPADAGEAGAPAPSVGGKYVGGTYYFSPIGVDLRESAEKMLLGGAFYNHALVLAGGPVTEATVDRLLASFGASTKLVGNTTADAGDEADELLAEYASKRDNKSSEKLGPYRRMRFALLSMKAAAAAGSKCNDDLQAAVKVFLAEWEKATYATAIYYLNDAAAKALANPPKTESALHVYGEALGFVQSFKGIAADRRKITDAQIDELLAKMGATTPYQLATRTSDRVPKLIETINAIAAIYGWTPDEVDAFEKAF
jgi:hypothetical protein